MDLHDEFAVVFDDILPEVLPVPPPGVQRERAAAPAPPPLGAVPEGALVVAPAAPVVANDFDEAMSDLEDE